MQDAELFAAALGLQSPWYVSNIDFSLERRRLNIHIDFERGSTFSCACCGESAKAYDTKQQSWRHINFFQHEAHLHARVPRLNCTKGCGVKQIEVPWARSGSGFTLLFEAMILSYCREMPVDKVGELMGEYDTRLWRVIHHYVDKERAQRIRISRAKPRLYHIVEQARVIREQFFLIYSKYLFKTLEQ